MKLVNAHQLLAERHILVQRGQMSVNRVYQIFIDGNRYLICKKRLFEIGIEFSRLARECELFDLSIQHRRKRIFVLFVCVVNRFKSLTAYIYVGGLHKRNKTALCDLDRRAVSSLYVGETQVGISEGACDRLGRLCHLAG